MLCLAGPMGDTARALLEPDARLLSTFEAGSTFEAMNLYNQRLGRGPWTTGFAQDHEPYPDEWRHVQDGSPAA
jgi:hypothetical protein